MMYSELMAAFQQLCRRVLQETIDNDVRRMFRIESSETRRQKCSSEIPGHQ